MHYLTPCALAVAALLAGCANPNIPDFMVEGTLPDFGGKTDAPAPKVAVAETPKPEKIKAPKVKTPEEKPKTLAASAPGPTQPAPKAERPAPALIVASPAPPTLVGGYQPATDKRRVESAAAFAVEAAPIGYLLKGVKSARSQVVAGTNYELCLKVRRAFRETSGWRTRLAKAVVYENLQGQLELTQWSEVETCP